jgi:hypothetical protein
MGDSCRDEQLIDMREDFDGTVQSPSKASTEFVVPIF